MKSDRRYFAIHGRRNSCGTIPQHGGNVGLDKTNAATNATPTAANGDDASRRKKSARLREKIVQLSVTTRLPEHGIAAREIEVAVRENAANGRETRVSQREDAASERERECEIRVARTPTATQEDFNSKLRQANENLVIASVQFQTMADDAHLLPAEVRKEKAHAFLA